MAGNFFGAVFMQMPLVFTEKAFTPAINYMEKNHLETELDLEDSPGVENLHKFELANSIQMTAEF
jgi:hypothetical protein